MTNDNPLSNNRSFMEPKGVSEDVISSLLGRNPSDSYAPEWKFGSLDGEHHFLYWGVQPDIDWHYVLEPVPRMNLTRLLLRKTPKDSTALDIGLFGVAQEAMDFCQERYSALCRLLRATHEVWKDRKPTTVLERLQAASSEISEEKVMEERKAILDQSGEFAGTPEEWSKQRVLDEIRGSVDSSVSSEDVLEAAEEIVKSRLNQGEKLLGVTTLVQEAIRRVKSRQSRSPRH